MVRYLYRFIMLGVLYALGAKCSQDHYTLTI